MFLVNFTLGFLFLLSHKSSLYIKGNSLYHPQESQDFFSIIFFILMKVFHRLDIFSVAEDINVFLFMASDFSVIFRKISL